MRTFTVTLMAKADDPDTLTERMQAWDFQEGEGVLGIMEQPDPVPVPPNLRPPPLQPPTPTKRTLESVEPNEGPAAGGTEITLHGTGFTNIGGVRFEGEHQQTGWAWSFEVVDDNTITCPTPPMAAGVVDVVAFNGDPGDAVLEGGFTYV